MKSSLVFLFVLLLFFCSPGLYAQNYAGSYSCGYSCHPGIYTSWTESAHYNSLKWIFDTPPEYPFQYIPDHPNVPSAPYVSGNQLSWDDVSLVIGGYRWKAQFLDQNGYIITGDSDDATQWLVQTQEWEQNYPGEQLDFDCAECHSMGYEPEGHQSGLPGITGTWFEDDVGCESCHGPNT